MKVYWLKQLQSDVPANDSWLAAAERDWLANLRFPKRRGDWRLGRWTAKVAIAIYLDGPTGHEELATIAVLPASSGAPEVFLKGEPAPVSISLSHRDQIAMCAVAPAEAALGCDLELIEPRTSAFISD